MSLRRPRRRQRKAAVLLLSAFLMIFVVGVVAFAIDVGYIVLVRTQLQTAADSAAMAAAAMMGDGQDAVVSAAKQYAAYHKAGGANVSLSDSNIEFGTWDTNARTFTTSAQLNNAVRITTVVNNSTGNNRLFFGRIFGKDTFNATASAIAMGTPRDIALVVDLSGSMNDDCEPCWATNEITNAWGPQGYPTVATDMMQDLYTDLGFGTFPGTLDWVGAPAGVTADSYAYANLTKNSGYLTGGSIAATYKIASGDSEATRKTKAYKWIIDTQLASLMPAARPAPNSSTSYNFWEKYLDYIIQPKTVNSGTGTPPTSRGSLPPNQDSDRISGFNNPNTTSYASASSSVPQGYRNQLGYRTFVQFLMDNGRNVQPDGATYAMHSVSSSYCPYHSESTAGGTFNFPPREQPTHAARRSLIAAVQEVVARNATVPDNSQKDWVSLITFDTVAGTQIKKTLTTDYSGVMTACTTLQAVGDNQSSTATETGLLAAFNHIKPTSQGGSGRDHVQKVVVFLTDGMPNLYSSSSSTISAYRTAHPSSNFYGGSSYAQDSALVQATSMEVLGWYVYPVGLGLGCDYDFMDRSARMGGTANDDGQGPRTSGNPTAYESELTTIFHNIITNPQVRLVK